MAAPQEHGTTDGGEPAVPQKPPATDTRIEQQTGYAEPVDPWATGEAAALAAGNHLPYRVAAGPEAADSTWTVPGAAPAPGAGAGPVVRPYRTWGLIAAAAAVVAVAVTAAVVLWPGVRALEFHPVQEIGRFDPAVPITTAFSDAELIGERAYFASTDVDGRLGVVAVDTGSRDVVWSNATVGTAGLWDRMVALPQVLVVFSGLEPVTGTARMRVLSADDGEQLWNRPVGASDTVHFGADTVLLVDRVEERLLGLDLTSGKVRWEEADPDATTVVTVTTPADLAGPAGSAGRPFSPDITDDDRFVQINSDRSASVRDIRTGKVTKSRPSVAGTSDEAIAHNGRLFVQESGNARRIFAYDLDDLGEPTILHTAEPTSELGGLTPCGDSRLCFVETPGYDRDRSQVAAVDAEKGGELWRRDVAEVDTLIPVGDAVLAVSDETSTLLDSSGGPMWTVPGVAVRLDAGNLLRFSDSLTTSVSSRSLSGVHVGDEPAEMGLLRDVRPGACAWNTSVLACVREADFALYSFA
ncbi:PQQ-binding-like beta-propeller repeat protein [Actinoplanes sp. DH11]|uniref:outer membrane protein assembly factor BamB family protein n=1 Tax=Actinoplanes sp. DH11 TaxID=2857011 RepID=UPI001E62E40C|nr:PQQ-binding-like beta-propeller repeat protein [Actinoplanes sp. DH11]